MAGPSDSGNKKRNNRREFEVTRNEIIVVGASAGGIKALEELLRNISADLRAAILIVLHISPWSQSRLPEVLGRSTSLPVGFAVHDSMITAGHVYLAPPDHHLLIDGNRMQLWRGPKPGH